MPRSEGFLDPGAGPLATFAWDLRALREKAGAVPYRVLAKRAGFCASTLSVAASGARLPSLDVTLAYVQACGGDPEAWRTRWHELAVQHPPTHSGPQPGLLVAPPYDADEHDDHSEQARLDAVALHLPPAAGRSTDRELVVAGNLTSAAVQHDGAGPGLVTQVAAPPAPTIRVGTGERLRGTSTSRSGSRRATPIGRVAVVALTLATALLGWRVATEGTHDAPVTSPPPAASAAQDDTPMQQADTLYILIYGFTAERSDTTDAIWDVGSCRNLSNAQSKLRTIARERQRQVEQLAALNVSKVPDHVKLVAALQRAWIKSAQSDTAYANIAADLQSGCTTGAVATDPNYQQADDYTQAAAAASLEAARLWNANADALGQLTIDATKL